MTKNEVTVIIKECLEKAYHTANTEKHVDSFILKLIQSIEVEPEMNGGEGYLSRFYGQSSMGQTETKCMHYNIMHNVTSKLWRCCDCGNIVSYDEPLINNSAEKVDKEDVVKEKEKMKAYAVNVYYDEQGKIQ